MASIDDIEDIGRDQTTAFRPNRSQVVARVRKKSFNWRQSEDSISTADEDLDALRVDSFLPNKFRIHVKTWGCAHNTSDEEYMAGLLADYGFRLVSAAKDAHLLLLNSCTVKNPSEDHFRNEVLKGLNAGQQVVVSGCVPQSAPKLDYISRLSIIGVQQIDRCVEVIEETLKGNVVRLLGPKKDGKRKTGGSSLDMPKVRRNPLIEIIAINTGCLNECTYCKTRHARGVLGSYTVDDIVQRAQKSFKEGVKEIWLTSEDTGAYGRDIGTNLPQLLYALIAVIPDDCRLRLGMTNPPYILEHLEAMADILLNPKIYSFLHIPVQSGSDCVLADMKREYCIEDFEQIVDFLKSKVKGITIATDIICGFPTETEADFEETMKLVKKYKFPSLFINQFYPRPGTPAAKMKRLPNAEVKQRTKSLSDLFASYKPYENRIGTEERVLVTEESHDKRHYVGHNQFYEQILVAKDERFLGQMIDVVITSTGKHFIMGSPIHGKSLFLKTICSSLKSNRFSIKLLTQFSI
ncbi:unnamed protein product [Medioppia subpectinata]|uniref:tRNA-t(6)A37 methylthiotransferase n=1 Tax=Medioppia subpectinata TaxID=1979941 RepID=A0A7R9KD85_9ACAR|nr:unnamed protein product [Medioppia subpectinata]CAG2101373.1 unnamed protein product [Medioppia subpectinata]